MPHRLAKTRLISSRLGDKIGIVEMNPSRPPSFFSLALKQVTFLVGGVFLLVGIPFLGVGLGIWAHESGREKDLAARGVTTEATILDRSVVRRDRSTRYLINFRFQTADGRSIQGSAEMEHSAWAELPPENGGTIEVRYLPEDPGVFSVPGESSQWVLSFVFTLLGGVFSLIGAPMFILSLKGILLYRRLFREGMPVQAEIIEVSPSNLRINNVRQWRIQYRYNDAMGGMHEGKSPYLSPEKAQGWQVGQKVEVRFDPRKPSLSAWIGEPS